MKLSMVYGTQLLVTMVYYRFLEMTLVRVILRKFHIMLSIKTALLNIVVTGFVIVVPIVYLNVVRILVFILTLNRDSSLLTSVQFLTAWTVPQRDPMSIPIEGSNQSPTALLLGSSWT